MDCYFPHRNNSFLSGTFPNVRLTNLRFIYALFPLPNFFWAPFLYIAIALALALEERTVHYIGYLIPVSAKMLLHAVDLPRTSLGMELWNVA